MKLDPLRIGCGDLDYVIAAYDAGLVSQEQLALDARIYIARKARPKYDAVFTSVGR